QRDKLIYADVLISVAVADALPMCTVGGESDHTDGQEPGVYSHVASPPVRLRDSIGNPRCATVGRWLKSTNAADADAIGRTPQSPTGNPRCAVMQGSGSA